MPSLESEIETAKSLAIKHSEACASLIKSESLAAALNYCQSQDIEPPQCSLTAQTANAQMLRDKAVKSLSDLKWWSRRLEKQAIQNFEQSQRLKGNTANYISDEVLAYMQKRNSKAYKN